jgi:hypothetical protein
LSQLRIKLFRMPRTTRRPKQKQEWRWPAPVLLLA